MSEFVVPIQETAPELLGIKLDDFVLVALDKQAIDPLNAARLLASNASELLSAEAEDGLSVLAAESDGQPIENRILAPLLRVLGDFKDEGSVVFKGPGDNSPWTTHEIFALDEAENQVVLLPKLLTYISVNPRMPSMFSLRDDAVLERPVVRRQRGDRITVAARFAIGLSYFDVEALNDDFAKRVNSTHRHFELGQPLSTFDPRRQGHLRAVN